MRAAVIYNPAAGGGRGDLLAAIAEAAADAGLDGPVLPTARPGDATDLARVAARDGAELVIAAGGDGTASEVAAGLLGTSVAFALAPIGTGNDLARELGVPRSWRRALAGLPHATRRRIDVGMANGQPFLQSAGAGLDGYVTQLRARPSPLRGSLAYTAASLQGLLTFGPVGMTLTLDGERWAQRCLAVTVANGAIYGGGLRIAPGARNDDGQLDAAIIGDLSRLEALRMFPLVYFGRHTSHPQFALRRGTRLTVETDHPVPVHVDGTVSGTTPAEFSVRPGALEVLAFR